MSLNIFRKGKTQVGGRHHGHFQPAAEPERSLGGHGWEDRAHKMPNRQGAEQLPYTLWLNCPGKRKCCHISAGCQRCPRGKMWNSWLWKFWFLLLCCFWDHWRHTTHSHQIPAGLSLYYQAPMTMACIWVLKDVGDMSQLGFSVPKLQPDVDKPVRLKTYRFFQEEARN